MEPIIPPIPAADIEAELTEQRLLRTTNRAANRIYVVDAHNAPMTMREIGRLREQAFRAGGGGTGKDCDIDEFDLMDPPCQQLLVWDPEQREIIGAYRYLLGSNIRKQHDGTPHIAMAELFKFSNRFVEQILPISIELGRSFVSLTYQSTRVGTRAIYALDNLWDGLGALTVLHPEVQFLFGKMTMYTTYPRNCRNLLLFFLRHYFPDHDQLALPYHPLNDTNEHDPFAKEFFIGNDFDTDYRQLNAYIRQHGINIPPLINAYMMLSPSMRVFGTAVNPHFGNVEETGILIDINQITQAKKARHIDSFIAQHPNPISPK